MKARKRSRWKKLLWLPVWLAAFSVLQVLALRWIDPPTSSFMLIRQVDAWRAGEEGFALRQQWRDLEAISPHLPISVVAAEDQKFPQHHGFDLDAMRAAHAGNARGGRIRGASTITQQVAKNLFLWSGGGYVRKGIEAWYTLLIELLWPKQRILEVYVNIAEFGDGVYGAEAAAQAFFRKPASALTAAEAARLAAVLPAPRRWSAANPGPYVQRRAAWIQRQVRQLGGPAYLEGSS
ncbi:monofunctional biosynthetic peptidoglycan transglycosylase [Arenimonas composti]|uniref:Biosynthetic peptidoglycan transglycosylase n=1 Tax=Arenimonas composti TR7-09 = DSM 18010 TaxID=1121013 RepID=A0A091BBL2_9GAMM|nr:monofunctional biosynthetic peptidoglycan transglycosylase [Arenimonas composti]KFN48887.1 hypothetical protein P873_13115 [Arenimonas composti TR7-09 = DSM 18010]